MINTIVFRVDASLQIGTGHVMRCLTLAESLKENGADVEFICRKNKGDLIDKIRNSGFNVLELEALSKIKCDNKLFHSHWLGTTQQQDAKDCIDVLQQTKIDWMIVDHYSIDEDWQKDLKDYYCKLMVIDDLADRKHQCDILLDQTFGIQEHNYKAYVPEKCMLLLGSKYALIRPGFAKWRQYSLDRRRGTDLKKLLINMGGVDADNVTAQVLRELEKFNLPNNIEIVVVMGGTAPHLESIKAQVNDFPYTTEVKVNINNMAEIMANADIAIGAAGATTWERCCLGLPTIQIAIAKNQEFSAEALANNNIVKPLTSLGGIQNLLKTSAEWMIPTSKAAAQVCDGMGVYRVLSELNHNKITLEKFGEVELHNYVNLTLDEKALVLDMRNHPEVKKWMHNQDEILQKTHFEFIQNLKNNATRKYFLVKQRHKTIGSINFSKIESRKTSVEFGIYTNPFESLQGAGRILETIATYYAFKRLGVSKLKLEVYSNNERAINFYNKCGFVLAKTKKVNGKGLLYMEKTKVLSGINDQDD